ncbi:MAG TPA: glycosyltransferase, partial [Blastocatellia bacterium]|nr:glycosyltransferase [Blastocatellia bacterium]
VVFYTKFGLGVFERACLDAGIPRFPVTAVIPHGIDSSTFHPLSSTHNDSRRLARLQLFPDRPELRDAFIVLNANRNCPRKRIDLTLRAFAEFSRGKADTYLYLHMGMVDSGYDLLGLSDSLSISGRLLVTTTAERKPGVPDSRLNLIYNASNVGVNTATGEGWGFAAFEHAATLGAQLVPDHSACRELWKSAGSLIGLQNSDLEDSPADAGVVSIQDLSRWLDRLYARPPLLLDLAERSYRHARADQFGWDSIARRWQSVFTGLLQSPAPY